MAQHNFKPRPLKEQVIVITGASSGIGLATAKMAAKRGARVVLSSRNEKELNVIVNEITEEGGSAIGVAADVGKYEDLEKVRTQTLEAFDRIDTWINNAGTSLYGYLMETDIEEERKLFETNFWGTRYGSQIALEEMSKKGGTIINLGSEVSVAAQPLMGMYSASKHALKAFTEALRSELRDKQLPIEVSLVRPTAIATPFAEHGANRLDEGEPALPSPLYHPDQVAEAILKCAVKPQRDIYVGGPARLSAILDTFFPQLKDIVAETRLKELKKGTAKKHQKSKENLHHAASGEGEKLGHFNNDIKKRSVYTELTTLGVLKTLVDASGIKKFIKHKKDKAA